MPENVDSIDKALQALIQEEPPCMFGAISLHKTETKLFYRSPANGSNGLVDFMATTEESLNTLADACTPASFGVGGQDVLDESYRKAGKLDVEDFAAQFTPLNHGFIDLVQENLFKGTSKREIQVELYKLNVYGPGAFFKAHVDTPRSDNMFGSLVIVLPTRHEGGALVFRHGGKEWTFDSAKAVCPDPSDPASLKAGFAMFYSDVEHEVMPIVSGHRVTLTYNLYFAKSKPDKALEVESSTATEIQQCLQALLDDKDFLPEGGLLGFRLAHKYPVNNDTKHVDKELKSSLKGSDGCVLRALDALGVKTSLHIFYQLGYNDDGDDCHYMFDKALRAGFDESSYSANEFAEDSRGKLVQHLSLEDCYNTEPEDDISMDSDEEDEGTPIYWVNSETKSATQVVTPFLAYGNQASLGHFYGEISIVANIKSKDSR